MRAIIEPNLVPIRNDETRVRLLFDPPEADRRWPAPARLAVIFGCAAACWAMIGVPLLLIWG